MKKQIFGVAVFAIAMGLLECVVVIYLRLLYYPLGFSFPLKILPQTIGFIEICRETATIVMLTAIGVLSGKSRLERFAYFGLAFAIWDLFYYVFLYLFIAWPQSLFTFDILFLIPLPWIGPVWAPCLLSLLMLLGSIYIITKLNSIGHYAISRLQWIMMFTGAFICIVSFLMDFIFYAGTTKSLTCFLNQATALQLLETYIPEHFHSNVFFIGFGLMGLSLILSILTNHKKHESE